MFEAQLKCLESTLSVVEKTNPAGYATYGRMVPTQIIEWVYDDILTWPEGSTEPFFKPHPQWCPCCITADFNFAHNWALCNLITDPALRQECKDKATMTYCAAIELCNKQG